MDRPCRWGRRAAFAVEGPNEPLHPERGACNPGALRPWRLSAKRGENPQTTCTHPRKEAARGALESRPKELECGYSALRAVPLLGDEFRFRSHAAAGRLTMPVLQRHSREGGNPFERCHTRCCKSWVPGREADWPRCHTGRSGRFLPGMTNVLLSSLPDNAQPGGARQGRMAAGWSGRAPAGPGARPHAAKR